MLELYTKIKNLIYRLLRRSEKYAETDMIYLAKGSFWLSLGQVVCSASAFLLAIAFANLLPKETYGLYRYILSIFGTLAITTLAGMGTAINQAVARGHEGSVIPGLKTKIRWSLLGSLISLGMAGYYYYHQNLTLTIALLIVALFLPLTDSFGIYDFLLQGKKLFKLSARYLIITQVIATSSLIITLFLTKNLYLILIAYFFPLFLMHLVFYKITLKKFPPNDKIDPQTISYGKHLTVIGFIGTIANYLDRLLVFHFLGPVELAIYSLAISPPEQVKGLFKNIPALILPKLSNRSFKEINSILLKRLWQLFLIGLVIFLAYIIFAPIVYKIFFPKYLDSIFYSQIFAITILLTAPNSFFGAARLTHLTITPKKTLYLWNIPSLILILTLIIFVRQWGIMGVIISKIIFTFANFLIGFFIWKKIGQVAKEG